MLRWQSICRLRVPLQSLINTEREYFFAPLMSCIVRGRQDEPGNQLQSGPIFFKRVMFSRLVFRLPNLFLLNYALQFLTCLALTRQIFHLDLVPSTPRASSQRAHQKVFHSSNRAKKKTSLFASDQGSLASDLRDNRDEQRSSKD